MLSIKISLKEIIWHIFSIIFAFYATRPNEILLLNQFGVFHGEILVPIILSLLLLIRLLNNNFISIEILEYLLLIIVFTTFVYSHIIDGHEILNLNNLTIPIAVYLIFMSFFLSNVIEIKNIKLILIYFIFFMGLLIAIVIFQNPDFYYQNNPQSGRYNYPFVPFGMDKNTYSMLLVVMALSSATPSRCYKIKIKTHYFFLVITLGSLVYAGLMQTRATYPLILMIFIILFMNSRLFFKYIFALLILFIPIFFIINGLNLFDYDRSGSNNIRLEMIKMSLNAFIDQPFFGVADPLIYNQKKILLSVDHNIFSLILGYFGVFTFALVFYFYARSFIQYKINKSIILLGLFLAYIVMLFFTPFYLIYASLIPFIVFRIECNNFIYYKKFPTNNIIFFNHKI